MAATLQPERAGQGAPREETPFDSITLRLRSDKPKRKSKYIKWSELLRRVFGIETVCGKCHAPLRLIALIKDEAVARKILAAMHLPTEVPQLHHARSPPERDREGRETEDHLN